MLIEDAVQEVIGGIAEWRRIEDLRVRVEVSAINRPARMRTCVDLELHAVSAAAGDVEEFSLEGDGVYRLECDLVFEDVMKVRCAERILAAEQGLDHAALQRAVLFRLQVRIRQGRIDSAAAERFFETRLLYSLRKREAQARTREDLVPAKSQKR